jgi:hypothetical protein
LVDKETFEWFRETIPVEDSMEFEDALSKFEPEQRNRIAMAEVHLSGLNRLSKVGRRLSRWSDRAQFLFVPQFETIKARKLTRHLEIGR